MSTKRTLTALAGIAAGLTLLAGCTNTTPAPTPTASTSTPSPSATASNPQVSPPESEDDAIADAETVLTQYFVVRGEVNAAGGTDTAPLEAWATGRALEVAVNDAAGIAKGPILNTDQKNIDGPGKTEGAIKYETTASYGQEWEGVENGLITINACQDASEYKIYASDGSEAMRPAEARSTFDYQVVYDSDSEKWLVYDLISLGESC